MLVMSVNYANVAFTCFQQDILVFLSMAENNDICLVKFASTDLQGSSCDSNRDLKSVENMQKDGSVLFFSRVS